MTNQLMTVPIPALDAVLAARFEHHIENSIPEVTPEHNQFLVIQRQFIDSLSEVQQAAYRDLESMLARVESSELFHFYRLGFKEGHPVLGGAIREITKDGSIKKELSK